VCCAYFCTGLSIFGLAGLVRRDSPSHTQHAFCKGQSSSSASPKVCLCAPAHVCPRSLSPPPAAPLASLQLFMYTILNTGGELYLGVSKEDAPAAASACLIAAGVYGVYLVYCGLKLGKAPKAVKDDEEA
jgi:hypothetical protein